MAYIFKLRLAALAVAASAGFGLGLGSAAALADSPEGTWLTGPDRKGNVAHVEARPCGGAYCGKIVRAFNGAGQPITSPNLGRQVFWDMRPAGAGAYAGRAYVPVMKRDYNAEMQLRGNRMEVKGCAGPVCMNQVWTRVK